MSTFLTAEWRKLIMAQYAVDPAALAPYLPGGLELDLYRGTCFVSLIGFLFDRVRLKGVAIPLHTRFEEINLRFYVRRAMEDGSYRRGVVFIKEIVPLPAITLTARALYGEAYATAPTRHRWAMRPDALDVRYDWKHRGAWQTIAATASPQAVDIVHGSVEEFITEHYWGYTKRRGLMGLGRKNITGEYGVAHPRWQVYPLLSSHVAADFGALYGPAFAALQTRAPEHVLLAEGSAIAIRSGGHFTA